MATTPPIGGDDDDVAVASTKTSKNSFDNLSVSFRKLSSSSLSSRSWLIGIITSDDAAKRKSIRPNNQQHLQNDTPLYCRMTTESLKFQNLRAGGARAKHRLKARKRRPCHAPNAHGFSLVLSGKWML
jgi:hypothetical protein